MIRRTNQRRLAHVASSRCNSAYLSWQMVAEARPIVDISIEMLSERMTVPERASRSIYNGSVALAECGFCTLDIYHVITNYNASITHGLTAHHLTTLILTQ